MYNRLTKYGPRLFWKKHKLKDMPLGYGGCYVIQPLPNNTYRVINMSWHVFKKQNYDLCF